MVTKTEDNTQLMEDILRNAAKAPEPGTLELNKTVAEGTKDLPAGVVELKSAGYVYIYDTLSGEPSMVNRNMIPSKLQLKRPDGSFVFSLRQTVKPHRGTLKCMLHADDPNREHYNSIGLAVCGKSNLTSPFQVERHMQKRHRQEWEAIKSEKEHREREEDRDLQRKMVEAMSGVKTAPSVTVATQKVTPSEEPEVYISSKPYKSKRKKK